MGDDYGRPWNGPLAVAFPDGAPPSTARNMEELFGIPVAPGTDPNAVVSVHPTQLYETVLGFVMFAILWRLRSHKHAEGWLFGLYLVLAGVERFFIEFLKPNVFFILGLSSIQWLCVVCFVYYRKTLISLSRAYAKVYLL